MLDYDVNTTEVKYILILNVYTKHGVRGAKGQAVSYKL